MATYAYLRYSTNLQDEAQQLNAITNYLKQKGMTLDKTYMDEGISGGISYTKRNLYDLCKAIKQGDTVVVSEVSRLTRSGISELSEIIEKHFKTNKLRLIICNVGLDIDCSDINPMTELQLAMLATFAKIERNLIKERTKSALDVRKQKLANGETLISKAGRAYNKLGRQDDNAGTAWDKALNNSIETNKKKAQDNENNIRFTRWLGVWESKNGVIDRHTDLAPILAEVNALGLKTSSGMEFKKESLRQMIYRTHERKNAKVVIYNPAKIN